MATKKGRKTNFFPPFSFVALFRSGINIPDPPHCIFYKISFAESCSAPKAITCQDHRVRKTKQTEMDQLSKSWKNCSRACCWTDRILASWNTVNPIGSGNWFVMITVVVEIRRIVRFLGMFLKGPFGRGRLTWIRIKFELLDQDPGAGT